MRCVSQALLGRLYLTTAPHLDGIRNLFTFNTEALSSAELGKYDHACEGRPSTGQPDTADNGHMAAAPNEQSLPAEMIKVSMLSEHIRSYERPQLIAILVRRARVRPVALVRCKAPRNATSFP